MPICGKHRGVVLDNHDPQGLGRLQVSVPDVPGAGAFAMPCVPYAGPQVGFLALPPVGANVWVEFEAGDPNLPVWSGCFWGAGEMPVADPLAKFFKTDGITLNWSDIPGAGGFKLQVGAAIAGTDLTLTLEGGEIVIDNGAGANITLAGAAVTVNQGALVVS